MNTAATPTSLNAAPQPGAAILLIGPSGTGKTYSISTLVEAGLEVFVIGTEKKHMESLLDAMRDRKLPLEKLHWQTIAPYNPSWEAMIKSANLINTLSFKSLTELEGIEKSSHGQFIQLLQALSNFKDERTGASFGPVEKWGPDRALVIDGLSGLNIMAMDLVAGSKPVKSQANWGVAMEAEERLINTLTSATSCFFVLIGHVEREYDEISGGVTVQVGALGRKLAPKLPRFFSEVVLAKREGNEFFWSTATTGYDLKRRTLPLSEKITPSFVPLIKAWQSRQSS